MKNFNLESNHKRLNIFKEITNKNFFVKNEEKFNLISAKENFNSLKSDLIIKINCEYKQIFNNNNNNDNFLTRKINF